MTNYIIVESNGTTSGIVNQKYMLDYAHKIRNLERKKSGWQETGEKVFDNFKEARNYLEQLGFKIYRS